MHTATVQAFDEEGGNGKFIAAYIVSDEQIDIDALNNLILDQKPPYMWPSPHGFVHLLRALADGHPRSVGCLPVGTESVVVQLPHRLLCGGYRHLHPPPPLAYQFHTQPKLTSISTVRR